MGSIHYDTLQKFITLFMNEVAESKLLDLNQIAEQLDRLKTSPNETDQAVGKNSVSDEDYDQAHATPPPKRVKGHQKRPSLENVVSSQLDVCQTLSGIVHGLPVQYSPSTPLPTIHRDFTVLGLSNSYVTDSGKVVASPSSSLSLSFTHLRSASSLDASSRRCWSRHVIDRVVVSEW